MRPRGRISIALASVMLGCVGLAYGERCGPADLNEDGVVDMLDYLEFLNRYGMGDLSVDFVADGLIDYVDYLEFLNLFAGGCADPKELASSPLAAYPRAEFVQAFNDGSAVSISVDPFLVPVLSGGKATDVYITANRLWAIGDALNDVRAGGRQAITWPGGSIQANTFELRDSATLPADAKEDVGVGYDLVIDVNRDGVLDAADFIDGPTARGGFYKVIDLTESNAATRVDFQDVTVPAARIDGGLRPFNKERWFYPRNIRARTDTLPIVIISHGNGHEHVWYDHLGNHLASYGMIVVAHENDTNPASGAKTAQMTLDHLNTVIALQATLGGGVLNGRINQSELYLIGHSRGGEGVARAADLLKVVGYTPTGGFARRINAADLKFVQSIAPTDFFGKAESHPHDVDYQLLYGAADGDVSGGPSLDLLQSFHIYERAEARRNSTYVHGADHNVFNCCADLDFVPGSAPAATQLGRAEAQRVQKAATLAAIKYYRKGSIAAGEVLWRQWERYRPIGVAATTTVDCEFKESGTSLKLVVDDFQDGADDPQVCSNAGWSATLTVANAKDGPRMRDTDGQFEWAAADPFNGMTRAQANDGTNGVVFDYDATAMSYNYTFTAAAATDVSAYTYLSFRACQGTRHPETVTTVGDQDFEVELEDKNGKTSRIRISRYGGGIEEPYERDYDRVAGDVGAGTGWQNEFETIRIRLTDFTHNKGSTGAAAPDLTNLKHIRLLFGSDHGTAEGRLGLDDLEFVK